ncbi:MAG: type II secretion system F family protein [Acetobacteraceae bacterium]|nr:type II secretion system F family protein [Acetobacteraceae bacterium]
MPGGGWVLGLIRVLAAAGAGVGVYRAFCWTRRPRLTRALGGAAAGPVTGFGRLQAGLGLLSRAWGRSWLAILAGALGLGLGWALAGPVLGAAGAAVAAGSAVSWLRGRRRARIQRLEDRLEGVLLSLASSLQAGLSLVQAVRAAAEGGSPLGPELAEVVGQYDAGVPLVEAFARLARERPCPGLRHLARALEVHQRVGGDLPALLAGLAEAQRERRLLQGELRARTADARLTALILVLLPPALILVLAVGQPQSLGTLLGHPLGRVGVGYAFCSWCLGAGLAVRLLGSGVGGG